MSLLIPQSYAIQQSFVDFDDLAEQAQHWNLDLRQLDCGTFQGELLQFGIDSVHIGEARFGRKLKQNGEPPDGMRTIAVPGKGDLRLNWRGEQITGNELLIFPRGAELSAVSDSDFHVYTCSFPEELLTSICNERGFAELRDRPGESGVVRCSPTAMTLLRKQLRELCAFAASHPSSLVNENFENRVTRELPIRLFSALASADVSGSPQKIRKRERALIRAESYIERTGGIGIDVGDVCRVAEVSQRTLEYAFKNRFGLTPQNFLKAYRLNSVRRQLRVTNRFSKKIVDVANRLGFWHMGQFAADYQNQFGELPSQTVEKFATSKTVA